MGVLNVVRNNWKKIAFASVASVYGIYYVKSEYEVTNHMKQVCHEIANYADNNNGSFPERVLVVLNPAANKKKAEKKFKTYCEPMLHLAGYSVEVFKTNYVGHAKSFIEKLLVLPDVIVVAGGDGTSSEVVTGLMRRHESSCPIVLLPLGNKNETALNYADLQPKSNFGYIKSLSDTVSRMVNGQLQYKNLIKFDVIEKTDSGTGGVKPIYGLNKFSWGLLRDIESVQDKYWYFGQLRHYAAAILKSLSKDVIWTFSTEYVYTPPCPGCKNCSVEREMPRSKSYLSKFLPNKVTYDVAAKYNISNENCNMQISGHIESNQLNIECARNADNFYELETQFIDSLTPGLDFFKNISNIAHNRFEPSLTLKCRTIELIPDADAESKTFYAIDGEEYDVRPIKVSLVPNAIKVFC